MWAILFSKDCFTYEILSRTSSVVYKFTATNIKIRINTDILSLWNLCRIIDISSRFYIYIHKVDPRFNEFLVVVKLFIIPKKMEPEYFDLRDL